MRKPKVVLNNWSVVMHGNPTPYTCPESIRSCLGGDVVGHPNFDDGHYVTTSPIVGDPLSIRDGMIVHTANTQYILEGVCPKYKAWCDANSYSVKAN